LVKPAESITANKLSLNARVQKALIDFTTDDGENIS